MSEMLNRQPCSRMQMFTNPSELFTTARYTEKESWWYRKLIKSYYVDNYTYKLKKNKQIKNYTTVYPTAMLTMKYIHVVWMMN